MDATTHVRVAETEAAPHTLQLSVVCHPSGEHTVDVAVIHEGKLQSFMQFTQREWSFFKGSVLAADRTVLQLRDKGLIFSFGPVHSEPQIPEPKQPGEYRIKFVAEKMTSEGLIQEEFENLADVSKFVNVAE
jgi:hypothetical protein